MHTDPSVYRGGEKWERKRYGQGKSEYGVRDRSELVDGGGSVFIFSGRREREGKHLC